MSMNKALKEIIRPVSMSNDRKKDIEDVQTGKKHIYAIRPQSSYLNPKTFHSRTKTFDLSTQPQVITRNQTVKDNSLNNPTKKNFKTEDNKDLSYNKLKMNKFKKSNMFRTTSANLISGYNFTEKQLVRLDTSNRLQSNPVHLTDFEENWKLLDASLAKNPIDRCKSSYNFRKFDVSITSDDTKNNTGKNTKNNTGKNTPAEKKSGKKNETENKNLLKNRYDLKQRKSYSELTKIVNEYHPKVKVKDFTELRSKENYLDVLNETIEFYEQAEAKNNSTVQEIPCNKYIIFNMEKSQYSSFCINTFNKKGPLRGCMQVIDGYNTNYAQYVSFDLTFPGNTNGYYKKFINTKDFKIECSKLHFKSKFLYCSQYCESSTKIKFYYKFADQTKILPFTEPVSIETKGEMYFEEFEKKFLSHLSPEGKKAEYRNTRKHILQVKHRGKDFVERNKSDVWHIKEIIANNQMVWNEKHLLSLARAVNVKKENHDNKTEKVYYNIERNKIRRNLFKNLLNCFDNLTHLNNARKFWFNLIYCYKFMEFTQKTIVKKKEELVYYFRNLMAFSMLFHTYKETISKTLPTLEHRLRRDTIMTMNFLAVQVKSKNVKLCKNIASVFLNEVRRVKNLLNFFKSKIRVMQKVISRPKQFRINEKKIKLDTTFMIIKRWKTLNDDDTQKYPRRTIKQLEILVPMFFAIKKKKHLEDLMRWYNRNLKGKIFS